MFNWIPLSWIETHECSHKGSNPLKLALKLFGHHLVSVTWSMTFPGLCWRWPIKTFLDLSCDKISEVAEQMMIKDASGNAQKATVNNLVKIIEDLTRILWKAPHPCYFFCQRWSANSRKRHWQCRRVKKFIFLFKNPDCISCSAKQKMKVKEWEGVCEKVFGGKNI